MDENTAVTADGPAARARRDARSGRRRAVMKATIAAAFAIGFVVWAHFGSSRPTFTTDVRSEPGWEGFRAAYGVDSFGIDGYFVRAVQNGYNLVHHTHKYADRFTRRTERDRPNACSDCHSVESLAYAFVISDRFDPRLNKRISFEERVMRCYAQRLDGFIPTIYDPAVRDIRMLARMVAHHLQLGEGTLEASP